MKDLSDNRDDIIDYLLGARPEPELERFEQRYLQDESLFVELQEIEDELIDDYVSGALTGEQRTRFDNYFLSSTLRREKVEFARAMTEHAAGWKKEKEGSSSESSASTQSAEETLDQKSDRKVLPFRRWSRPVSVWRQWAAVAAAVLIAVGAGVLWFRNRELQHELLTASSKEAQWHQEAESRAANERKLEMQVSEEKAQNLTLTERLARLEKSATEATLTAAVGFALKFEQMVVGNPRGGPGPTTRLEIPAKAKSVQLNVDVGKDEYKTIEATLQRAGRVTVWSRAGLKPGATKRSIDLKIPADKLLPGDYTLQLSGRTTEGNQEKIGRYYLKVARR